MPDPKSFSFCNLQITLLMFFAVCPINLLSEPKANVEFEPTKAGSVKMQAASGKLHHGVDEAVNAMLKNNHVPGMAVVIVKDGKTVFKRGYGVANVEKRTPVDPDKTRFRIGSISKALTLLTLTRQCDQGRLKLEDDVSKFFGEIANPKKLKAPITIANLMTHTTGFDQIGIGRHIRDFQKPLAERKEMRPPLIEFLKSNNLRRVTPAGEHCRYDTYGTTLAGAVIQNVTQKPYAEAMNAEMFEPLGMASTSVEVEPENFADLAVGYGFENGSFHPQPYEVYVTTPASSIDSTPADMGRLLEALTGGGKNSHGRFLSAEAAAAVLTPQFRPHPDFPGTTHGLFESQTRCDKGVMTIGHGGSMAGFFARLTIIPEHNIGVFVIANRAPESGGGDLPLNKITETIVGNLPGVPDRPLYVIPKQNADLDLSEYVGDYYYGVFCHEGSDQDFANGAWRRGRSRAVTAQKRALLIDDNEYLPQGDDVFVRKDGKRKVFFGRDEQGKVSFYVFSTCETNSFSVNI